MKKRILSIFLIVCMVMINAPTHAFSPVANKTSTLMIEASLGSDRKAVISTDISTEGLFYAILGKDGVVVPTKTTGTTTNINGWYQASSANGISFAGIDPAFMPFQIVTSSTTDLAPAGTATAVTNGTAQGNLIYYYYIANDNTVDGFTTAGSDHTGTGTIQSPYLTPQYAAAKIGAVEQKRQGVIVLLDDTTINRLLQFPAIEDPAHPTPAEKVSQNVTITSNGAQHTIYRSHTWNTTLELCNKSRVILDNVAIDEQGRNGNNFGTIFLDCNTIFTMRGNSKIINGANRGVDVRGGATFIMENGEISGNTAGPNPNHWSDNYTPTNNAGGGVYICATVTNPGVFIMKGGKITGNTATAGAAGVYGEAGAIIEISGDSVVTGNTQNGKASNIYLNDNQTITLTEQLSNKANLGVYVSAMPGEGDSDVAIATGDGAYVPTASDMRAFSSDQETTAGVMLKNNQIVMSNEARVKPVKVSGKVSDYVAGKTDLLGITVQLYDAEDSTFANSLGTAATDEQGNYLISATVKKGNYVVRIEEETFAYDEASTAFIIGETDMSNIDLALAKYSKATVIETAINGTNGWYKNGTSDITLTAPTGFKISTSSAGVWTKAIAVDATEGANKNATYYLMKISNNKISPMQTFNYKVDKGAPEGGITIDSLVKEKSSRRTAENFANSIARSLLFNKDINVTITSSDALSGIEKVDFYKADAELTSEQLATVSWTRYTNAFTKSAQDNEKFIYYARLTDNAGNVSIINSQGVEFDITPPIINGVTDGKIYYTTKNLTIADTKDVTITVNGKEFVNGDKIAGNRGTTYKIVARDKAGNTTTVNITMKPIRTIARTLDEIKEDDKKGIEDIKKKVESIDTTTATDEEKNELREITDRCDVLLEKITQNSNKSNITLTGDNNNSFLWISLLFVSSGVGITLTNNKKRKKGTNK